MVVHSKIKHWFATWHETNGNVACTVSNGRLGIAKIIGDLCPNKSGKQITKMIKQQARVVRKEVINSEFTPKAFKRKANGDPNAHDVSEASKSNAAYIARASLSPSPSPRTPSPRFPPRNSRRS